MSIPLLRTEEPAHLMKYEMAMQIFKYPSKNVLLWVLHCLQVNTDSSTVEEHLASLPKRHKGYFHTIERKQLEKIKPFGLVELKSFDVPLLYKIIECTCKLDEMMKGSEEETRLDIKIKLDMIKDYRHLFAHDRKEVVSLSPGEFDNLIIKFMEDVDFLIRKFGELGGKSVDEIGEELEIREHDILSRWKFEDETTEETMAEETMAEETMETEFVSNSLEKTFQVKDYKMVHESAVSNLSIASTSEHRDHDVIMKEDSTSKILKSSKLEEFLLSFKEMEIM